MGNVTLEVINNKIERLSSEVERIKNILSEEYELSEWAKKELAEARKTPKEEHISQEEIEKEFLK